MSAIDIYDYDLIGMIDMPSGYSIMMYRLKQDVRPGSEFDGKCCDIMVGGGSGESAAMRISVLNAQRVYSDFRSQATRNLEYFGDVVKSFWSSTDAYLFGCDYTELGWDVNKHGPMETWLTEHVLAFLIKEYGYVIPNAEELESDGSICRLPTQEELDTYKSIPQISRELRTKQVS